MSEVEAEKELMDSVNRSYLDTLRQQDIVLEQVELILYKMHQLAQRSASDGCNDQLRQQLQGELALLISEIDQITSGKYSMN